MGLFSKKQDIEEEEEEIEYVLFQGATNGKEANLEENQKLAAAGLPIAKEIVSEALAQRADLFKVEPQGPKALVTYYVDGIKRPGPRLPIQQANALVQILKLLSGGDIKVRDKPQRGGLNAKYRDLPFELTVKSRPAPPSKEAKGPAEQLTVVFRNTKTKRATPEDIGIPEVIKQKVRDYATSNAGIILVVGPPESGLTTTALCALRCVDSYMYQCFIIGNLGTRTVLNVPIFKQEEGHTLEHTFMRIQRNEGNLIYMAELTDPAVAKDVVKGSIDMCFMAEMYARDAADGIARFVELVGDPALAAEQLKLVISHKLIRKLCPKCKEAFRPNPKLLAQVGLPEETETLYRKARPVEPDEKTGELPEPCRACEGAGFRARSAVFEMIDITEDIKGIIAGGGDSAAIRQQAKVEKQLNCQKDALRLVLEGETGLDELQRVFSPPGGPRRKKKPARRRPPE
ncbi:MAG: ATPase, T2SS/T4P/T4SS family [Planctomycetota bacterium]|nr:ATPase, T2SS/T4P/T4SS family [Planctomycetota bacterium]